MSHSAIVRTLYCSPAAACGQEGRALDNGSWAAGKKPRPVVALEVSENRVPLVPCATNGRGYI